MDPLKNLTAEAEFSVFKLQKQLVRGVLKKVTLQNLKKKPPFQVFFQ